MISIIIPTYNRLCLKDCLDSIANQIDPPEFEVIVVARDPWQEIYDIVSSYPFAKLIECNTLGNGPAKNVGAMAAVGDFLAFTDDDCILYPYWLHKMNRIQILTKCDMLVGQCIPGDLSNPYLIAHQGLIMFYLNKNPYSWDSGGNIITKLQSNISNAEVGTTMNMLIRKQTFQCLGGFNSAFANHFGDDYEFNMRWKMDPSIIVRHGGSPVKHNHQLTFTQLVKLSFRYGMGLEVCRKIINNRLLDKLKAGVASHNHLELVKAYVSVRVHPDYWEYKSIYNYIAYQSDLLHTKRSTRYFAAWLAIGMLLIKRLGSWYGSKHPEVSSKIYDGV